MTRGIKLELTGQRFGRLTAVGPDLYRTTHWLCQCDCGIVKAVATDALRRGRTKSCGCLHRELTAQRMTKHGHARRGTKSRVYRMYLGAKRRARKHGVLFELEPDDIVIPEFCPVFPHIRLRHHSGSPGADSPSLDRLLPGLGYTKQNIRVISNKANTIKSSASVEELRQVADWLERERRRR